MINLLIGFGVGLLVGCIVGYFVYLNNKKKIDDLTCKLAKFNCPTNPCDTGNCG